MKKCDFIDKYLLDVCFQKVKDTDKDIKDANMKLLKSMNIFPYESKDNAGYSNLISEDKYWYYRSNSGDDLIKGNSSNYRILDNKRLSSNHYQSIKGIFEEIGLMKSYSVNSIIDDLVKKMSEYTDYDEEWWSRARDIYDLWNGKNPGDLYKKATQNIRDNYFLFGSNCICDVRVKELLIKYGVYKDICEHRYYNQFFSNQNSEKVSQFLGFLGIQNEFVSTDDGRIEGNLYRYITHWNDKINFPINQESNEYEKCELIERLIKDIFYTKYDWAFNKILNHSECRKGLVVKNKYNQYISIKDTLFYNVSGIDHFDQSCDMLIINDKVYEPKYLERIAIDITSDLDPSEFSFDCLGNRKPFKNIIRLYSWLWQFNKSLIFASNVIKVLSNSGIVRTTNEGNSEFLIDVLKSVNGKPEYSLELSILISHDLAWKRAEDINSLFIKYFRNSSSLIWSEMAITKYDVSTIKNHILSDVNAEIYNKWFWDRVYLSNEYSDEESYLILNGSADTSSSILILRRNRDEKAYIRLIKKFIQQYYEVSVNNLDEGIVDWKGQYEILKNGISEFLHKHEPKRSLSGISFVNIHMNDVLTYEEEKNVWKDVKKTRDKIRKSKSIPDFTEIFGSREFLKSVYHGYCQVCHDKTCTSDIKSHFYTYRIVKPKKFKEDEFADMAANLFSVCPTCHGALRYGEFMGFNMENLVELTRKYVELYLKNIDKLSDAEGSDDSIISQFMYEKDSDDDKIPDEISNAIITEVMVNGIDRYMFFSWEHFIRLAMILNEDLIYNDD